MKAAAVIQAKNYEACIELVGIGLKKKGEVSKK